MSRFIIDTEETIELLGIGSSIPAYRLAWMFNRFLDTRLIKVQDFVLEPELVSSKPGLFNQAVEQHRYQRYEYLTEDGGMALISNRGQGRPLLKEAEGFDFLICVDIPGWTLGRLESSLVNWADIVLTRRLEVILDFPEEDPFCNCYS